MNGLFSKELITMLQFHETVTCVLIMVYINFITPKNNCSPIVKTWVKYQVVLTLILCHECGSGARTESILPTTPIPKFLLGRPWHIPENQFPGVDSTQNEKGRETTVPINTCIGPKVADQDKDTTLLQEDYKQFNATPNKHGITDMQNLKYVPLSFLNLSQNYGTTQPVNLMKGPTKESTKILFRPFWTNKYFLGSLNSVYWISHYHFS